MAGNARQKKSKCDTIKNLFKETCKSGYVRLFTAWSIWNIIRYVVVGYLIFKANNKNAHKLHDYAKYCCACYQKSKYQSKRFDLSYCIPTCTNCTVCQDHPEYANNTAYFTCPVPSYKDRYQHSSSFNTNWKKATGCTNTHGENVSITSMFFFVKSYSVYAKFALSIAIIYAAFNLLFAILTLCMSDMCETFFRWLWIYNIFITEACLYLMFKPFQYETVNHDLPQSIVCREDLIPEYFEHILTISIICTLTLTAIHFMWILGWILYYIFKCINSCHRSHRGRNPSIPMIKNKQIQDGNSGPYIKLASSKGETYKKFACLSGFIGILIFIVMLLFLVLVVMIAGTTLYHQKRFELLEKASMYMVYIFLGLSLIDNPWIVSKMCQFCVNFSKMFDQH